MKTTKTRKKVTKNTALFPSLATKTKTLTKPRSVHSKDNTLTYYNCLIDQVGNPLNERVNITSICHQCKHNKGKVKAAQVEHKQQLIKEVAQDYLAFGKSLGKYLHADITCDCKK